MVPTGHAIKPETKAKFFVKVIPQGVAPESVKPVAMSWKAGTDYTPLALSDNGTVSGEIAFVGYGISNPAAGYDDYAGIDVKGKIVIIIRGTPEKKVLFSTVNLPNIPPFARKSQWLVIRERQLFSLLVNLAIPPTSSCHSNMKLRWNSGY